MNNIPVFRPCVGNDEINAIADVINSGWLGLGPKVAEFESKFAKYIGTKHAVALNSGTSALDMALKLLNVNHGDEVIVPAMTFVSTAHAVVYNLATPIFADVDPITLNIDIDDVERKITSRTKAIIPVHYSGRPVDFDKLKSVVDKFDNNIYIIEDSAHATSGSYKGTMCGALGDISAFSFHAVKPLTTGDGGAITLNDDNMTDRAKKLRWLGIDKGTWDRTSIDKSYWWEYKVEEVGLKCHMNDMQAAMGLSQLNKIESLRQHRRDRAMFYSVGLSDVDEVWLPMYDDECYMSAWHLFQIKCKHRDKLSIYLKSKGISTGVHYKPIHMYSCYGNTPVLPNAESVFGKILTLPLFPDLSYDDISYITDTIKEFYANI